ncbi:TIGR01777 family oxidoreductase [Chitinophaga rhizosphaerae]|uniref:TIGR01777 family oxidoreductase n=1 Tax=Chitinophaga rhizosphaerae TaxID=1864947 RepID=UPI000F81169A|nr:TIGR01777 family oxidoreductase [Chitinophaga rhizosphaerae]
MKNKRIVIAGGAGFIGKGLVEEWGENNFIVILTRSQPAPPAHGNVSFLHWDGATLGNWATALEGADLLLNLCGKSVNCRYTPANKNEIFDSRTRSTEALGAAVRRCKNPPALWVNAASATIYRHAEDRPMDEYTGEFHSDFSVQVCQRWESAFNRQETPGTRKVILRMAIVIGAQGGVMDPYLNLLKFGLGGRQGSGKQKFSWVHIADVAGMLEFFMEHGDCSGVYNCSSPQPTDNRGFTATLQKVCGYYFGLPAPAWMLRIGAALIGTETELLLKSRWVLPTRVTEAGYAFKYPGVEEALRQVKEALPRKRYHLF